MIVNPISKCRDLILVPVSNQTQALRLLLVNISISTVVLIHFLYRQTSLSN